MVYIFLIILILIVLWFSWLILYRLYGVDLMIIWFIPNGLWFNSSGLNGLILHGLHVNDIMVYSS